MSEKKVLILLAAYKGGAYIRPMVDSILAQDCDCWRLVLSDDGEDTADILQEYADRFPDRITHYRAGERFGSAQKHFMHLLRRFGAQADYVMFADQDDVWHPDKVRRTLELTERTERETPGPVLVHTDLRVVDGELREIHPSFIRYSGLDGNRTALHQLLLQNVVTGCTMMLNRPLAELAARDIPDGTMRMHDWWLAELAAACGRVAYLDEATIDYRQHGDNTVGASGAGLATLVQKLRRGGDNHERIAAAMRQAGALAEIYADALPAQSLSLLRGFAALEHAPRAERMAFYRKNDVWFAGTVRKLGQKVWG